jgi:hypothetical protein
LLSGRPHRRKARCEDAWSDRLDSVNFSVADVGDVQTQIEQALRFGCGKKLDEAERAQIVRLGLKSDVSRNNRRAVRLELNGLEGFMIGFDQFKEGSCKRADGRPQKGNPEPNRPHH